MRNIEISILLVLGLSSNLCLVHSSPSYTTSELKTDETKLHYGATKSVFVDKETSHTEHKTHELHDSSLTKLCEALTGCPLPQLKSRGNDILEDQRKTQTQYGTGESGFIDVGSTKEIGGYEASSSTKTTTIGGNDYGGIFNSKENGVVNAGTNLNGFPTQTVGGTSYGGGYDSSSSTAEASSTAYGGATDTFTSTSTQQFPGNYPLNQGSFPNGPTGQTGTQLSGSGVTGGYGGFSNSKESGFAQNSGTAGYGTGSGYNPSLSSGNGYNGNSQFGGNGYGSTDSVSSSNAVASSTAYGGATDTFTGTSTAQFPGNYPSNQGNFPNVPAGGAQLGSGGYGGVSSGKQQGSGVTGGYGGISSSKESGFGHASGSSEHGAALGHNPHGAAPSNYNGYSQSAVNEHGATGGVYAGNAASSGSAYGSAGIGIPSYPGVPANYRPGQVDPGFARFPTPQQGGPMPTYPQTGPWPMYPNAGPYPYPYYPNQYQQTGPYHYHPNGPYQNQQTGPYPQPSSNTNGAHVHGPNCAHQYEHGNDHQYSHNHPQHEHHHHDHGYSTLDHTLKTNTEYTEEGHHEHDFKGVSNMGYGSGFGGTYNGGYKNQGY